MIYVDLLICHFVKARRAGLHDYGIIWYVGCIPNHILHQKIVCDYCIFLFLKNEIFLGGTEERTQISYPTVLKHLEVHSHSRAYSSRTIH